MAIKYYKLFDIMNRRGMKKKDLVENGLLSPATMAKLSGNNTVNTQTIDKLCSFLDVQPGDIMEFVREDKAE
ncbi:MAG: helix-turn-helix domain-containing protein [Bacteroidaceae bacterium]|nr:helix-turn-helix domain-containing protein [Bacteroidaceae bacterium]